MSQIAEQKCPACGAPMRFDPASGKLVCDYCGTVVDLTAEAHAQGAASSQGSGASQGARPSHSSAHSQGSETAQGSAPAQGSETAQGSTHSQGSAASSAAASQKPPAESLDEIEGFDFAHITDLVTDPDAMDLPVYNCVSCGAEVIAPAEQMALTCPYCSNNIVLTEKVTGKLRPDGVIPFRISAKELPDAVNRFYKDKKLLPRRFFSEATMGRVTGVYVPFWVFSGDLGGQLQYAAQRSSSSRHGDYIITQTNHYRLVRDAALAFDKLPVDASGKVEDRLMDSLEPFDQSQVQPFDMRYLSGFTADRFDQKKGDLSSRAENRMKTTAYGLVDRNVHTGYSTATRRGGRLKASLDAKYILFPVYMFDISHAGKNYHFAVNGQTGKVVGDIPTDSSVSFLYFAKRVALISGPLILYSIAKYMLGL